MPNNVSVRGFRFLSDSGPGITLRGARFAFLDAGSASLRGIRFAFEDAGTPSLRGSRFSFQNAGSPAFRGTRFSFRGAGSPSFRGTRFAFQNAETPILKGVRFSFQEFGQNTDQIFSTDGFAALEINQQFSTDSFAANEKNQIFSTDAFGAIDRPQHFSVDSYSIREANNVPNNVSVRGFRFLSADTNDVTLRGARFAFQDAGNTTLRGVRFAFQDAGQTSFRGVRFAFQNASNTNFRGTRFSFVDESSLPSVRGFRFIFQPPTTQRINLSSDGFAAFQRDQRLSINAYSVKEINQNFNSDAFAAKIKDQLYSVDAFSAKIKNQDLNTDAYSVIITQRNEPFSIDSFAAKLKNQLFSTDAFAAKTKDQRYSADAFSAKIKNQDFNTDAFSVIVTQRDQPFSIESFAAKLRNQLFGTDAFAAKIKDQNFATNSYAAVEKDQNLDVDSFAVQSQLNNINFDTDARAVQSTIESVSFDSDANSVQANATSNSFSAVSFAIAEESHVEAAYQTSGFNDIVPGPFIPVQGTCSGSVSVDPNLFVAWIQQDISSVDHLVGRVDFINDEQEVGSTVLSSTTGIEGVKVAFIVPTNEWAIVWKKGSDIKYSIFSMDLSTQRIVDASITSVAPNSNIPDHFDIGTDNTGNLYVIYFNTFSLAGEISKIDAFNASPTITTIPVVNASPTSSNRMVVHKTSGNISVLYASGLDGLELFVDQYVFGPGPLTVTPIDVAHLDSVAPIDPMKVCGIAGRDGNDGFIVCWLSNSPPENNVHYRIYDATATAFVTPATRIDGSGFVDPNTAAFFITLGSIDPVSTSYSFSIKAVDTSLLKNYAPFIWTQVKGPAGSMGQIGSTPKTELVFPNTDTTAPAPIIGINEYEYAIIYNNGGITKEIFVPDSVYMGLWRIDRNARIFANSVAGEDVDSVSIISTIYTNYDGGSRSAGSVEDATNSNYLSLRSKDPTAASSFTDFLNPAADEDSIFIGGPIISEVAATFNNGDPSFNSNTFVAQLSTLYPELGLTNAFFIRTAQPADGFALGISAPALRIINNNGIFTQNRHITGSNTIDYAMVIRLAVNLDSTQATKSIIYAAGINRIGTKAAAFCLANPTTFHLGDSSACLVVLTYPNTFDPNVDTYVPGTTGTISVIPLADIITDDFEG